MTTKNRIKTVLTLAVVAMAVLAGSAQALECQLGILDLSANDGINPATGDSWAPGDQYRFVFHTSATIDATSADIATYNAWVQGLADASTAYDISAGDGATWKVIGSTDAVDARDNTSTNTGVNGTGCAIFLLDGSTVVANDYADLWDGSIQNIINLTEQGVVWVYWPWTGTRTDGTAGTGAGGDGNPLGSTGQVGQGNASSTTDWIWRVNTMDPPTNQMPMYALSEPLVIVGQIDPNLPDVDVGLDMITWSGQAVTIDADVVGGIPPFTYAWTAEPNGIGDPDLDVAITGADQEDATVTITKTPGDVVTVKITLAVTKEGIGQKKDRMTIDVYDDACVAALDLGLATIDTTDFDGNCITNFADFALLAATWLDDYKPTGPVVKP